MGRKRSHVVELARDVWPEEESATADSILEYLLDQERLVEERGRRWLGDPWADLFDTGGRGMHANLDSTGLGVPAVDASTGEIIAYVAGPPTERKGLAAEACLPPDSDGLALAGEATVNQRAARAPELAKAEA